MFFDDNLVYSSTIEEHVDQLRVLSEILKQEQLYLKTSKCVFGANRFEYLGHVITRGSVSTDPKKIEAMVKWPAPKALRQLRGFLGLTGYYRRFIRGYSVIVRPLTLLLKKDSVW